MKTIKLCSDSGSDVVVGRGLLALAEEYFDLDRRVFVLTDREVPGEYVDSICLKCTYPVRVSVWPGEDSNSIENYERICQIIIDNSFSESDCILAIGGERVLNLGGFVAATFKGGIDRYCVPTTFVSQIGGGFFGNSRISLNKNQNVLGAYKQPTRVLVDPDLLKTLKPSQMSNGFAEAVKLALLFDKNLFEYLESEELGRDKTIDHIVARAIEIRNYIYRNQADMPEMTEALSFGSIIANALEKTGYSKGERLAIGMLPLCSGEVRGRLRSMFSKMGLPVVWQYDVERLFRDSIRNIEADRIALVRCDEIGKSRFDKLTVPEFHKLIKNVYGG